VLLGRRRVLQMNRVTIIEKARSGMPRKFIVLVDGKFYGEYLTRRNAVKAAQQARTLLEADHDT